MKITNIKAQVKRQGRYSIFVDGKYSFSLSEPELIKSGLKLEQEVTEAGLDELQDRAAEDKAIMRSYDLLARRRRSEWEIRDYLKRKDYEPELIDRVIERLFETKYLDDLQFAKVWVDERRRLSQRSDRQLQAELMKKRIGKDVIDQVLGDSEQSEEAALKELVAKKRKIARYEDDQKLMAFLARRGFNYHQIKSALEEE